MKKNGLNLILTVGCSSDGILFLLPQFLSYVLLKENIFTLNSIENQEGKPHSICGIVVDCAMAEFCVIDN